jgi:Cof subfamily protein (haloacid dehalogenase superfamily)
MSNPTPSTSQEAFTKPAGKIKLVISDVDGTLVTQDKELTQRAIDAVRQLHEAGIIFVVTSGRPPAGMKMLIEPLKITSPIPGFNGGMICHPDMSIIEQHSLPTDVSTEAIKVCQESGVDVWVYAGNDWFVTSLDAPHVAREEWTVKLPPKVLETFDGFDREIVKVVGVSDDAEKVKKLETHLQSQFGPRVSATRSQPYYVDITHPLANKGTVVGWMSKFFEVDPAEVVTLGDQPNDVLMFAKSGFSIAVGNASPEVQRSASYVSTSNEDEGFANGIEKFVLPHIQ